MPKKRSLFQKICCCLCDDTEEDNHQQGQNIQQQNNNNNNNNSNQRQQNLQPHPQPPLLLVPLQQAAIPQKDDQQLIINVKRDFNLSLSQISATEDRLNEEDYLKYKYNCPICLKYFNKILKAKCCNNYVCFECESDIHQQMLSKKIESLCWWCKNEKCEIIDVIDGEQIKNYSDAAQNIEDKKKKEIEKIQGLVRDSKIQRQSMLKTFKSQQDDKFTKSNNQNNPLFGKTFVSQNCDSASNNLGTLNKNQWNNFNQNVNRERLEEEEEEEEKYIDKNGIIENNFRPSKTDNFGFKPKNQMQQNQLNSPSKFGFRNSSLCFNVEGQAVPIKHMQQSLEQQYKRIDQQEQPIGYFFTNINNKIYNNNNDQNNQYQMNEGLFKNNNQQMYNANIKENDPYSGGPNQQCKENLNRIKEKQLSSDGSDNKNKQVYHQNKLNIAQDYHNKFIDNDSDINDRL